VPVDATTAPYVGRRRVAEPKAPRRVTLAGATVPATAAAALSLVATGAGVAAGVDGAAVAQTRHPEAPAEARGATAATDITTSPQDVLNSVTYRAEQASRGTRRTQIAAAAAAVAAETATAQRWVLPLTHYVLTSPFGMRWGKLHAGEDFAAPIGTPVHAISAGTIVFAGVESGYGNKIEIRHWDGTCSWYGHLSKIEVKVGQKVTSDQLIGLVGDTGHSTGPHLHLEIHPHGGKPVDPIPWLKAHGLHP
jgi:murein DD-endopeptidase MepM/ murein hydrolase activator NlpD